MKITKAQLTQIIEEELQKVVAEAVDCKELANIIKELEANVKELEANARDSGFGHALLKNKKDQFKAAKCQPAPSSALQEGIENFTPENLRMVIDSLIQMGIPAGGVVAAAMALTNFFEGKPRDLSAKADLYAAAEEEGAKRS